MERSTRIFCASLALGVLATLVVVASSARAQAGPQLDGKWAAKWLLDSGAEREAVLTLSGGAGTWRVYPRGPAQQRDPCFGREMPVLVSSGDDGLITLKVEASKAITGCADSRITAKSVDPNTLEGTFGNSRPVKLTRQ